MAWQITTVWMKYLYIFWMKYLFLDETVWMKYLNSHHKHGWWARVDIKSLHSTEQAVLKRKRQQQEKTDPRPVNTLFSRLCLLGFRLEWDVLRKQLNLRHFQAEKYPSTMQTQNNSRARLFSTLTVHWTCVLLNGYEKSFCKNSQFLFVEESIMDLFFLCYFTNICQWVIFFLWYYY